MTVREIVVQTLDEFSEGELQQVAEYLAFLKFRARVKAAPTFDPEQAAVLYHEFAAEDRALAEAGMAEYRAGLHSEDAP